MTFEVKGTRPGQAPDVVKKQNLDQSLQMIRQYGQLLQLGSHGVLEVPFVHQERGDTCFWACCLAVQSALKTKFRENYSYFDKTETQVTQKARALGLLVEGGTNSLQPGLMPFLNEELGLVAKNGIGGVDTVRQVFEDLQQGNITMVNFPYEGTGHWNVVRAIVRNGDSISFDLMDPIVGNHVVNATGFADGLTHVHKDGRITSASSISIELPKPVFKIKNVRPATPAFKIKNIRKSGQL